MCVFSSSPDRGEKGEDYSLWNSEEGMDESPLGDANADATEDGDGPASASADDGEGEGEDGGAHGHEDL
jgi:hypothetical protein